MSSQVEFTVKAMVYAVIVFMSMIQFGALGDVCRTVAAGGGICPAIHFSAIAFGVIVTVPALVILVLFLIKNPMAHRVDSIAAPILFVIISIGTALSCRSSIEGFTVFAFAAILAFIASLLLNIYNITNASINIKISTTDASEKPAVASEPVPSAVNV